MAEDKKISQLNPAAAFTGAEKFELVQGGLNLAGTPEQMKTYIGGITREFDRAFSAETTFDHNVIEYEEHTLTGDVEFTIAASGNLADQDCSALYEIITDGTHTVTFTGFKYVLGDVQSGSMPDAGTYPVMLYYSNGRAIAIWGTPSSEVANLIPLAAPANFVAVPDAVNGDTELDLSSNAVANASSYETDYSTTGGGGPWINLPAATGLTYAHTGLTASSTYHYRKRAIGDGVSFANSQYTIIAATTEDPGDVTAPVLQSSPADSATDIVVNQVVVITSDEALRDADGVTEITNANILDYITAVNSSAGAQTITATIDITKKIITITPNTVWDDVDDITITVDGVEDLNGNEPAAFTFTFTTTNYTEMNANYLSLGNQIDSVVTGADINFELEIECKDMVLVGTRGMFQKSAPEGNQVSLLVTTVDDDVNFAFYLRETAVKLSRRTVNWPNALSGFTAGKITFKYFGAIDTNDGLDRVQLFIDDVEITAGKNVVPYGTAPWPFDISAGTAPFYLSGPTFREARNFKVRNNMGATTIVDIPIIRTGVDVSGNSYDGTWI